MESKKACTRAILADPKSPLPTPIHVGENTTETAKCRFGTDWRYPVPGTLVVGELPLEGRGVCRKGRVADEIPKTPKPPNPVYVDSIHLFDFNVSVLK